MKNKSNINCIYPFQQSFQDYPNLNHCISIYFMGCEHECKNCLNPQFRNKSYTNSINVEVNNFLDLLEQASYEFKTTKICFLGGDPLYLKNLNFTKKILTKCNKKYDICIYTGYTIDYVKQYNIKGFEFIKCGKYIQTLSQKSFKTDEVIQFASCNQKLYDKNYNLLSDNGIYKFIQEEN